MFQRVSEIGGKGLAGKGGSLDPGPKYKIIGAKVFVVLMISSAYVLFMLCI